MAAQPCWDLVTGSQILVNNTKGAPLQILDRPITDLDIWRLSSSLDGTKIDIEDPGAHVERIYYITGYDNGAKLFTSPSGHKIEIAPESISRELVLVTMVTTSQRTRWDKATRGQHWRYKSRPR